MRKKKEVVNKPVFSKKYNTLKSKCKQHYSIIKIHETKIIEYSNNEKLIKEIDTKIKNVKNEIESYKKKMGVDVINNSNKNKFDIEFKIRICNENITKLNQEKQDIIENKAMTEYILNTCSLINEYMELEDEENKLIDNNSEEVYLQIINQKKKEIVNDYMKIVDPNYRGHDIVVNFKCLHCNVKCERVDSEGVSVCTNCGTSVTTVHLATELGYKESQELDFRSQFTYKKETHLDEWIRRFEAREHKEIPQKILDSVILEANKAHITDLTTLDEKQVKKYLKKLELNDYYDNVISIINRINKRPPFVLTPEIKTKIRKMFQQIQAPFEKYKQKRKNMLSYSYLLHQFFLILNLPEFANYFCLLKSSDKLILQDTIFKKIVNEIAPTDNSIEWRFFPSFA